MGSIKYVEIIISVKYLSVFKFRHYKDHFINNVHIGSAALDDTILANVYPVIVEHYRKQHVSFVTCLVHIILN